MSVEIIPTRPGMGRSLIEHDERSRNFPVRGVLTEAGVERYSHSWRRGNPYDQGRTSTCVAQTFKGVLNTQPASGMVPYRTRSRYDAIGDFYPGAQLNDEWPGESPTYEGTSALGMCKYLNEQNLIDEYRWCFGLDDVLDTLSQYGPVGIGVRWLEDMFSPDEDGTIHVSGEVAGGHEVELIGLDIKRELVKGVNSWGTGWGVNGRFYLSWADLDTLLRDDGDAVTVVSFP